MMAKLVDMMESPNGGGGVALRRGITAKAPSAEPRPVAKAPPLAPNPTAPDRAARLIGAALRPRRHPSLRTLLMTGGILVVLAGAAIFWLRGGRFASTDDAYVQDAK